MFWFKFIGLVLLLYLTAPKNALMAFHVYLKSALLVRFIVSATFLVLETTFWNIESPSSPNSAHPKFYWMSKLKNN